MAKEVEVKILEVNPKEIKKILKKNKAKLIMKKNLQKSHLYQSAETKDKGIIRLRKDSIGERIAIKTKLKVINGLKVLDEFETAVKNINVLKNGLEILGFKQIGCTESIREDWGLYSCVISLIKLPRVPYYVEIEGSQKNILKVARLFGYSEKDYCVKSVLDIYDIKNKNIRFK